MKRCTKCGVEKELSEFYNHTCHGNVLPHAECKVCTLKINKINRNKIVNTNTDDKIKNNELNNQLKVCVSCKQEKPIQSFSIRRSETDGHSSYCRECSSTIKNNKYNSHKQLTGEEYIKWRMQQNTKNREERQRAKLEVFSHYCKDGIIKCANPYHVHSEDMTDLDILTIDHINGDGHKEPQNRRGGVMLYRKLKQSGYPTGFQVLCANCQFKKKAVNCEYGEYFGKVKPINKSGT